MTESVNDPELVADLARHIVSGDAEGFDPLLQRVFAYQYQRNAPYRTFCNGRGVTPETVRSWKDIPAAPAAAFKRFALSCVAEEECIPERGGRVFWSSGTTGAETSRHYMDRAALDLYRLSLRAGYRAFVCPEGVAHPIFALLPPPEQMPHSSLSFMLGELVQEDDGAFYVGDGWQARLLGDLQDCIRCAEPVTLFGTAFAWVHLFDSMAEGERIFLPTGSRIVETGGFKGRSREVSRDELYGLFTERLNVSATHCLSEYGMSEMASQFYDTTLRDAVQGTTRELRKASLPHLLRTRVMDPVTGNEAAPGEPGLLAHYDLANLNSVAAIQTEDYGYAHPDGEGFVLLGRAPGAVLRGCSLTSEELMG